MWLSYFAMAPSFILHYPLLFEFFVSDIETNIIRLTGLISLVTAWLIAPVVAFLTVFRKRNLGFLMALISSIFHLFGLLSIGIDFGFVAGTVNGPIELTWLISFFVIFPIAMLLLLFGRPEFQKMTKSRGQS
jgi:hypothetical protein